MVNRRVRRLQQWPKRVTLGLLEGVLQRRGRDSPGFGPGSRVTFFIWNAHSMGGTVRTVLRQAEDLAGRGHPVTIVSVVKHPRQTQPFFAIDPRVRHEVLVDRPALAAASGLVARFCRWLDSRPSVIKLFSIGRVEQGSLLVDLRLLRRIAAAREGVVIATRLGLNLGLARFGHPAAIRVGQEHLYLDIHEPKLRRAIGAAYPNLDVVVCLTEQDAAAYRAHLGPDGVAIEVVPNAIPDVLPPPAALDRHRIVAVGRFTRMKGFDLLVDAFARIAPDNPTWELRLIGRGPDRDKLRDRAEQLGVSHQVKLPGPSKDVQGELAAASIFVLSSRFEPFGIVLLEAMSSGLCLVSFASDMGPRELITHEEDGLLVPPKDVTALAAAMQRVIDDEPLRRALGDAARRNAERYTASRVGDRWIEVFDKAAARRASGLVTARVRTTAGAGAEDREQVAPRR